jgi:outer membrane lipoprotein-sorting protein
MKDNNIERTMAGLFTHHLEKAVPEGADLWPVIRARLAERNFATELRRRRGLYWFGFHHVRIVSTIVGVLAVVIGLYWGMIQPVSADAKEILKRAQDAQVLSTNSGIHTFILTQKINEQSSLGEFQAEIKRWYQEPGLWRVESGWTGTGLTDEGTRIAVSDGTSEWIQQGDSVAINRATPQPETDDLTPWGRDSAGLTDVLNQVGDLYASPNLQGEETIAGRPAYVIDLGLPNHFSNSAPELNNGRRIIWVDKETFFLLKAVQYSPTDGSVVGVIEVTHIQYNIPIDPGVFSFTPPPGAQVHDFRSANDSPVPEPSPSSLTNLAEARQKVSFSIFIPTVVPAGLVTEHLIIDEGPPTFVKVDYRTKDGSIGLSVLNGPAGSGLAADPRKKGETIKLRGDILGHFLNNEPQFGGPILWWEEAGSYVALSGPELNKTDLVKIADSMSSTADIGSQSYK